MRHSIFNPRSLVGLAPIPGRHHGKRARKVLFAEPGYHYLHGYGENEGEALSGDGDSSQALLTSGGGVAQTQAASTPSTSSSWFDSVAKSVQSLVPLAASVYQQQQLTKLNVARAQQGQPLISAGEYAQNYQPPVAQVSVGVSSGVQKMLMYGALGLGGLFVVNMLMRRR